MITYLYTFNEFLYSGGLVIDLNYPFNDFPDFGNVLDEISNDGYQLHYRSMRLLYADEGLKWRRKWEPVIIKWKKQSENWVEFVTAIRENKSDRLLITRNLLNDCDEPELRAFFTIIYKV